MKRKSLLKLITISILMLALGIVVLPWPGPLQAQGPVDTAFTYQGRLDDSGSPAGGAYDFRFILYNAPVGGAQVGGVVSRDDVAATGGYFTVQLDFGAVFDGSALWLEIAVRPGAETGAYTTLSPRQPLTAIPYALNSVSTGALQGRAVSGDSPSAGQVLKWDGAQWKPDTDNAGSGGGGPVSWNDLTDIPSDLANGDDDTTYSAGTGLNLNGNKAFSLQSTYRLPQNCSTDQIAKFNGSSWVCAADQGADLAAQVAVLETQVATLETQVSTLETEMAELAAMETRLADLETLLFHVSRTGNDLYISGANLHVVNGTGTTDGDPNSLGNVIIGYNEERSSDNDRSGSHMLVVGNYHNYTRYGGIVVGHLNTASGDYASVSGGVLNTASGASASVSGGFDNTAIGRRASVSGGYNNEASDSLSSVSGGLDNTASGQFASISGGSGNTASGDYASVSGGAINTASGEYASVSGGGNNEASDSLSSVSGGQYNTASGQFASISGGSGNTASGDYASVSGGLYNTASGERASVSGGSVNTASGGYSSVSGGGDNTASGSRAAVSGGYNNTASGGYSSVSGGNNRSVSGIDDWRAGTLFEDR